MSNYPCSGNLAKVKRNHVACCFKFYFQKLSMIIFRPNFSEDIHVPGVSCSQKNLEVESLFFEICGSLGGGNLSKTLVELIRPFTNWVAPQRECPEKNRTLQLLVDRSSRVLEVSCIFLSTNHLAKDFTTQNFIFMFEYVSNISKISFLLGIHSNSLLQLPF